MSVYNLVYVAKTGLPAAILNRLLRIAAFQNPEFYKAQSMRLSTYDKPRVIACGEDLPNHIVHQTQAVEALITHEDGILCAPTAFSKTVVAALLIAARNVPPSSWFTANN